jgi:redox-sensitive bicupin YhaK (pirin superfamily)
MEAGSSFDLPHEHEERAVYVVCGDVEVAGSPLPEHHLAVLPQTDSVRVRARSVARVMLLGGSKLEGDRHIWWNFVASSRELIAEASERWKGGTFPMVPGDPELIPLPEDRAPRTTFVP